MHNQDFNGDGYGDQITFDPAVGLSVKLSNGQSYGAANTWSLAGLWPNSEWIFGDFNGDGKTDALREKFGRAGVDVLTSTGTGFSQPSTWSTESLTKDSSDRWVVGDFNGDGKDDLLRFRPTGADVLLSNGTSFSDPVSWEDATSFNPKNVYIGDFNGDGKSDLMTTLESGGGAAVYLSNGAGFDPGKVWISAGLNQGERWTVGDFNGDGKDDLLRNVPYQVDSNVMLSNGVNFYSGGIWSNTTVFSKVPFTVMDVNGDGTSDLVGEDLVLLSKNQTLVPTFKTDLGQPVAIDLPKFVITGKTLTLQTDNPAIAYFSLRSVSTGAGVETLLDAHATSEIAIDDRFIVGHTYVVDLWQAGATAPYASVPFQVMPQDGAAAMLDVFQRFQFSYLDNSVDAHSGGSAWKDGLQTFTDLATYLDATYLDHAGTVAPGVDGATEKALFLTTWVNSLWGYGNKMEFSLPGRAISNEAYSIGSPADISLSLYLNSEVADCQDYAALLAFLLTKSGYANRIVLTTGHVFNEVQLDGQWWTLDSTFGLAYSKSYQDVLDTTQDVNVIELGLASAEYASTRYRDYAVDSLNQKLAFDAFGHASSPQYLSVAAFYDYLYDGFIYQNELGSDAGGSPDSFTDIVATPSDKIVNFSDFYNWFSNYQRFDIHQVMTQSRVFADHPLAGYADDLSTFMTALTSGFGASAFASEFRGADAGVGYVLYLAQTIRELWSYSSSPQAAFSYFSDSGTGSLDSASLNGLLGYALDRSKYSVRILEADGSTYLEAKSGADAYVIDIRLGIVFHGSMSEVLGSNHVDAYYLTLDDIYGAGTHSGKVNTQLQSDYASKLLKIQLGYLDDYTVTDYASGSDSSLMRPLKLASITSIVNDPSQTTTIGDFNGDGLDDLLVRSPDSHNDVYLSNGTGFAAPTTWTLAGLWPNSQWYAGDFNGDGKDDLLRPMRGGAGVEIFASTGSGFAQPEVWSDARLEDNKKWFVGDFNGDGKDDLMRTATGNTGAEILLSTGTGFSDPKVWSLAGLWPDRGWYVGDFNGDGKDDLMRTMFGDNGLQVLLSDGEKFLEPQVWTMANVGANQKWYVGDFNHDGKADAFSFTPGGEGILLTSNGTAFTERYFKADAGLAGSDVLVGHFLDGSGDAIVVSLVGSQLQIDTF